MNKKTAITLGVLAACTVAALCFWLGARFDQSGNEHFAAALQTLKHLDTRFSGEVLKARFKLLDNYDEFPQLEQEMSRLTGELKSVPGFVDGDEAIVITNALKDYEGMLARRAELFEDFKSQNAVLNNSLAYFPVAGEAALSRISGLAGEWELAAEINNLLRGVLAFSLNLADDQGGVDAAMASLRGWESGHPESGAGDAVANLLVHARTILKRTAVVDGLAREIVSLPAAEKLNEVSQVYDRNLGRALGHSSFYRVLLYVLCGALAVCIVWTVLALRQGNLQLEQRVWERTAELQKKSESLREEMAERQRVQLQLVQTSRLAGMAEVASSVLHNVGNVLNSINVSACVVAERLKKSKASNLSKAVSLLRANESNLGEYLTRDAKGRQLPGYFAQLSEHLAEEQSSLLAEVSALNKHVDHVKDVIAMQQSYAKVSGVTETVKVTDLVEDALRMNATALMRHDIHFDRDYPSYQPEITVEKHKVLQILVNLIRNAKQACDHAESVEKRLTLRVTNGDGRVRIAFADNGVGIPPENLSRIFNHGFTTKKDGHGFGLHSGALAAKEMGGSLTAHSEGAGKGATFTLELPLQPKEVNA